MTSPYPWGRIAEYAGVALVVFFAAESATRFAGNIFVGYAFNIVAFAAYALYLVRRERIDVKALLRAALKR